MSENRSGARAFFEDRAAEWLVAADSRRSRRAFDGRRADAEALATLAAACGAWQPYPDSRVVLVVDPAVDVFSGIIGSYGKVTGAPHVLVCIGDTRSEFVDQHLGYAGEGIVLEATRLGLATCWVGGFFDAAKVASVVELAPGERVFAVSPVGHALAERTRTEKAMVGLAGSHKRRPLTELTRGADLGGWPMWAVAAVEAARLAPSATNRQPWRFRFDDGALIIEKNSWTETPKVTKRLDIGIAMLHAELAARAAGVEGEWTDLQGNDVACFRP